MLNGILLTVDDLELLDMKFTYDQTEKNYKFKDCGHGSLGGSNDTHLVAVLRRLDDEKILVIMNGRWMAVMQRNDRYFLFKCLPTFPEGSIEHFGDTQSASFSHMDGHCRLGKVKENSNNFKRRLL